MDKFRIGLGLIILIFGRCFADETSYSAPFDTVAERNVIEYTKFFPQNVHLYLSPDGTRYAVVYQNNGWNVDIGTEHFGPYDVVLQVNFSPDGTKYYFWANKDKSWFLNVSGIERQYALMTPVQPVISANSRSYGFLAYDVGAIMDSVMPGASKKKVLPYYVVFNGKIIADYDDAENFLISPDGMEYALIKKVTIKPKKEKPEEDVPKEKKKTAPSEFVKERLKKIQADLEQLEKEQHETEMTETIQYYAVINGKEAGPFEAIPFLKNINNAWVFVVKQGNWKIYRGSMSGGWDISDLPALGDNPPAEFIVSPDGKNYAFTVINDNGETVVYKNGIMLGSYQGATALTFSATGMRFAYVAKPKKLFAVYVDNNQIDDGKGMKVFDTVAAPGVIFSKDEKHYACLVKSFSKWYAIVDGKKSAEFDAEKAAGLEFSDDGLRYAFITYNLPKSKSPDVEIPRRVIIDGTEVTVSSGITKGTSIFSPGDTPQYLFGSKGVNIARDGKKHIKWTLFAEKNLFSPDYETMSNIVYSPDGKRYTYLAYKNKKVLQIVKEVRGK